MKTQKALTSILAFSWPLKAKPQVTYSLKGEACWGEMLAVRAVEGLAKWQQWRERGAFRVRASITKRQWLMATAQTGDLGKSRKQKRQKVWRLELPVPSSPLRMSCYPFLCLCEGNSSGIQITATNAERAGWKPLCERVENLIHLKTWQVLWNNPLEHVWLTSGEAG